MSKGVKKVQLVCACGKSLDVWVSLNHAFECRITAVANANQWRVLDETFRHFKTVAALCRTCNATQNEIKTIRAGHD